VNHASNNGKITTVVGNDYSRITDSSALYIHVNINVEGEKQRDKLAVLNITTVEGRMRFSLERIARERNDASARARVLPYIESTKKRDGKREKKITI